MEIKSVTSSETIIYLGLAWRARGLVIERWSVEDKSWHRHSSAPNYRLLLDRAAAATYGEPTSAEGFATLRKLADDEQDRMQPKPRRDGLGWLRNVKVYSTDADVAKHPAGDYRALPSAPQAKPRPPLPPVPADERERFVFDPERVKAESLAAIEQAEREALEAAEAGARKAIEEGIGAEKAKAIMEAEQPIMLDAAVAEAELMYRDAVQRGSAADQLAAIRTKKALQKARAELVWYPPVSDPVPVEEPAPELVDA
jgi:hypothetical protein